MRKRVSPNKQWTSASILVNRFHLGKKTDFEQFFPDQVKEAAVESDKAELFFEPIEERIGSIHYSWLVPVIQKKNPATRQLILAALPQQIREKLAPLLEEKLPDYELKAPFRTWVLSTFAITWTDFQKTLSPKFLPDSDLTPLLSLSKKELVLLIDYLGIYDLSQEIRTVVDKKLIEMLYKCLSNQKRHFLRIALHQKEKTPAPSLNFEHWDGDAKKLFRLLHHRGIVRLAVSLSGQSELLTWHFIHALDVGRGEKLAKYIQPNAIPLLTNQRIKQVLSVFNFIKNKRPS